MWPQAGPLLTTSNSNPTFQQHGNMQTWNKNSRIASAGLKRCTQKHSWLDTSIIIHTHSHTQQTCARALQL